MNARVDTHEDIPSSHDSFIHPRSRLGVTFSHHPDLFSTTTVNICRLFPHPELIWLKTIRKLGLRRPYLYGAGASPDRPYPFFNLFIVALGFLLAMLGVAPIFRALIAAQKKGLLPIKQAKNVVWEGEG